PHTPPLLPYTPLFRSRAAPKTQCTIRQGNQCLISAPVELLRHPAAREDDRVHRPDSPLIEPSSERTAMIKAGSKPLGRPVISQGPILSMPIRIRDPGVEDQVPREDLRGQRRACTSWAW